MRITKVLVAGFLAVSSIVAVGVAPAGAPPIVTGSLAPTTEGGVVVASWTTDSPGITVFNVLLEAPAECPSIQEWFDGWGTGYQTIPVDTDTSGTLSIEGGSTVRDLAASGVEVPLPTGLYEVCLYWVLGMAGGNLLASLEAEIGVPEPTTTTTAAATTTTTTAPAAPATPRYTG